MSDLWIFGYGSLMWKPGFEFAEAARARLVGYRRCFCIYSTNHRGRPERPGLVLGLDRGGMCDGLAYRVAPENARATAEYLRVREQVNGVYREAHVPVTIEEGRRREVMAQAYIVERAHPSFTGPLSLAAAGASDPRRQGPVRRQPRLPDQYPGAPRDARYPRARAAAHPDPDRPALRARRLGGPRKPARRGAAESLPAAALRRRHLPPRRPPSLHPPPPDRGVARRVRLAKRPAKRRVQ